jgi:hypothetical protein
MSRVYCAARKGDDTINEKIEEALAAVGRDKVILGKPQVIRIEKN